MLPYVGIDYTPTGLAKGGPNSFGFDISPGCGSTSSPSLPRVTALLPIEDSRLPKRLPPLVNYREGTRSLVCKTAVSEPYCF